MHTDTHNVFSFDIYDAIKDEHAVSLDINNNKEHTLWMIYCLLRDYFSWNLTQTNLIL